MIRIGIQVADALEAAHRAGIVHRDVKPPNVLVPPAGPVKVTDFGIAKAGGRPTTSPAPGTVMGTARYLAPEQVNGRPTDARTDVYALGLLLYEMLCGRPPFGGDTDVATAMARLTTSAPPIRPQRPDVPPALDDIVHRCMARDPARRFPSAGAVRSALAAVRTNPQGPRRARRPPLPRLRPRPRRARRRSPPKARRPAPRRRERDDVVLGRGRVRARDRRRRRRLPRHQRRPVEHARSRHEHAGDRPALRRRPRHGPGPGRQRADRADGGAQFA